MFYPFEKDEAHKKTFYKEKKLEINGFNTTDLDFSNIYAAVILIYLIYRMCSKTLMPNS